MRRLLLIALSLVLAACAMPRQQQPLTGNGPVTPHFDVEHSRFVSFDGAELGLTVWEPETGEPALVVVGLHGMNDYANAFHMIAPWFVEKGVTTYAYDQRGFGRSVSRGIWPSPELLREDLRTAIEVARERHPETPLAVIGISMGASVAMTTFSSSDPPEHVDRLVLSGPGLRGWGTLNWLYRGSLWVSSHVRPGWVVRPPRGVKIEPSDNIEMLRQLWEDPLGLKANRIDQVFGVVSLMEEAHQAARRLPSDLPTFLTYGARDIVIPSEAMKRTVATLPQHVRTAYYPQGYHMLLRDLQAETVFADIWTFLNDPAAELPSGATSVPAR